MFRVLNGWIPVDTLDLEYADGLILEAMLSAYWDEWLKERQKPNA